MARVQPEHWILEFPVEELIEEVLCDLHALPGERALSELREAQHLVVRIEAVVLPRHEDRRRFEISAEGRAGWLPVIVEEEKYLCLPTGRCDDELFERHHTGDIESQPIWPRVQLDRARRPGVGHAEIPHAGFRK